ncbi:unnamed protein product [Caretta caretta]
MARDSGGCQGCARLSAAPQRGGTDIESCQCLRPDIRPGVDEIFPAGSAFFGSLDPRKCLVLGKVFNTTFEKQDCSGTEWCQATTDILWEIVDHHSLVDNWCDHHPDDESTFTYELVEIDRSCHSWLDCTYLLCHHLLWAHSSSIRPAPFLDHHLVAVMASLTLERPGLAYWHFNNSLLEDVGFVVSFQEFWPAWKGQRYAFPLAQRWWDGGEGAHPALLL